MSLTTNQKNVRISDGEILKVNMLCHEFGAEFPKRFSECTITPITHEFIFFVPPFVAKHRWLGLFSEEEGESLHAIFNNWLASGIQRKSSLS